MEQSLREITTLISKLHAQDPRLAELVVKFTQGLADIVVPISLHNVKERG